MTAGMIKPNSPDLYGLPEYRIDHVVTETDGRDVRIACGVKRFGEIHWLYSVVADAAVFLELNRKCREAAEQCFAQEHPLLEIRSAAH
jgi:hypothetical protein